MKKITMIALAMFTAVGAGAQTIYDATNIAQKELNGTARFVGMGGAMGALGGDISTIGTNPAGIGIYRSNDAMLTFGYSMTGTESNYVGNKFETNKNRWSFDNAGFVIASKIGNHTPLRYVNFGFNYHKSKSFDKNNVSVRKGASAGRKELRRLPAGYGANESVRPHSSQIHFGDTGCQQRL